MVAIGETVGMAEWIIDDTCLVHFEKWGRTDGRTEDMCENNDPYQPWLWVGRVDQMKNAKRSFS